VERNRKDRTEQNQHSSEYKAIIYDIGKLDELVEKIISIKK